MTQPVRIGLIGCGRIQRKHVRTMLERDDAQIIGLCDVNPSGIDWVLDHFDNPEALTKAPRFTDAGQMFEQLDLDAVSICTPHTLHHEHGMQALNAGLHVLMEKPMVTDATHAYEIAEKTRQTGRVFLVAYNTPCTPELAYIRDMVRKEELGQLELISGYLSQNWLKNTVGKWRQDPALSGGGQAYDSGAHLLASLCWSVEQRVEEVFAFIDFHGTQVDINSAINIRFEDGTLAALAISGNCPASDARMSYMLSEGKIEFNPGNASWIEVWRGNQRDENPPIEGQPTAPADNFLDAIQGKTQPCTSPENGIILSELMDLIYESARTNQPARAKQLAPVS